MKRRSAYQRDSLSIRSPLSVFEITILVQVNSISLIASCEFKEAPCFLIKLAFPTIANRQMNQVAAILTSCI